MTKYLLFVFAILCAVQNTSATDLRWDLQKVSIKKIGDQIAIESLNTKDCAQTATLNEGSFDGITWDQIVNIGQKVWEIVQAGKPVVHMETPVANALPKGLLCWTDLEHWQAPRTQTYEVIYQNGFGMEVVKFRFRLHYTYGGGKADRGQYLANVTVLPAELNVMWGYNFDAKVEVQPAVNLGTTENPIGGLELNVRWTVKTVVKESINSFHFFVQGNGETKSAD